MQINRVWVSTAGREDGTCAPEDGSTLRVPRGVMIDLAPEANEERWYERYKVLTSPGRLVERSENAFYSWYATNGRFARGVTQAPTRNNIWAAQSYPRAETMWILLRDGHGGTSGCRLALRGGVSEGGGDRYSSSSRQRPSCSRRPFGRGPPSPSPLNLRLRRWSPAFAAGGPKAGAGR